MGKDNKTMNSGDETQRTLLMRICDVEDQLAWDQFAEIYTPLIFKFCYSRGLQHADAADIAQEVMKDVARAIQKFEYDPKRSSFRNWLYTLIRNRANKFYRAKGKQPQGTGRTTIQRMLEEQPSSADAAEWDEEYCSYILQWAAREVRREI